MSDDFEPADVLQVAGLTFQYPLGSAALRDVSFRIRAGETVGLIGPNGAGKTTLMLHLVGLLPENPRPGRAGDPAPITVCGIPVVKPRFRDVRQRIGLLFQDPDDQLFCSTVAEDVAFGPLNLELPAAEVRARVTRALADVGLAGFEDRSPRRLSFGEKKRVCLAGVLACEPQLLVLDEPTSNLDPRSRRRFIEIIERLPAAQLIASHDLEMILEVCTRVLVIDEGRLQADGPARDILADSRLMLRHGLETPLSLRYGLPIEE